MGGRKAGGGGMYSGGKPCTSRKDCETGEICLGLPVGGKVCVKAPRGENCTDDENCPNGTYCVPKPFGGRWCN